MGSSEAWVVVWFGVVSVIGGNGFAAGIAAILYSWVGQLNRGTRVVLAAFSAACLPASLMIVIGLTDAGASESVGVWAIAFFVVLAVAALLSLPGAMIVSRRLEGPGQAYRAFQ